MISASFQRAFTLIEILIAMSIFAVMTAMAYGGLNSILTAQEQIEASSDDLNQLQNLFLFLQQDLYHASAKSTRDQFGNVVDSFKGGQNTQVLMGFVRSISPQEGEFPFLNVSYQIEDGALIRVLWPANGQPNYEQRYKQELVKDVESVDVQFYYQRWHNLWPPLNSSSEEEIPKLPLGIEFKLVTKRWGLITRVISLQ